MIAPLVLLLLMVLVPVKLTGSGNVKVLAPVTVILAPIWIRLALVKERLVNGAVAPTAPLKVTVPVPPTNVKAFAPFTVLLKVIAPLLLLLLMVLGFVKLTGSGNVKVLAPVTVMLAPI